MNVFIIAATSVDGFIAEKVDQVSMDWASKEDRQFFVKRTKEAKVVVMGATTYKTMRAIGHSLPGRLKIIYSNDPSQFAEDQKQFDSSQLRFTQAKPAELIKQLEAEGFSEVAICGGGSIYALFMQAGVVNTLYITMEPVIFGQGVKLFPDGVSAQLKLVEMKKLSEQTLLLEYQVFKS